MKSPKKKAIETSSTHELQKHHLPHSINASQRQNLPFTIRVANALVRAGITTIQQLCLFTVELLLKFTYNLGTKGIAEIEDVLAQEGKTLATTSPANSERFASAQHLIQTANDERLRELEYQKLGIVVVVDEPPASFIGCTPQLLFSKIEQDEPAQDREHPKNILDADILLASLHSLIEGLATINPALSELPNELSEKDAAGIDVEKKETGPLDLYQLWQRCLSKLNDVQQRIVHGYYGLDGNTPLTLQELGEELSLTRERIRQHKAKALRLLTTQRKAGGVKPLRQLLESFIQRADGLLTVNEWEQWSEDETTWESDTPRPLLLPLLCDLFEEHYSFNNSYQVAHAADIDGHLDTVEKVMRGLLRHHKNGLNTDELTTQLPLLLNDDLPTAMREPAFILKAATLFERISQEGDGRYLYFRKGRKSHIEKVGPIWLGEPGTRIYEWECKLRDQIKSVAWIGHLSLSEEEFKELCQVIQVESQSQNYFTKVLEPQPLKVPSALFITSMVFAARYAQKTADEFWEPFLQNVWGVEYTQAFMTRCRKRFNRAIAELTEVFHLEFPGATEGELVSAIYRHALLPRYMQDDFAKWLRGRWQSLLALADEPALLINEIRQDHRLERLPRPLQKFILGKETQETAADLIATMAAAIDLHINSSESIESITELLADSPIQQELWREIAQEFAKTNQGGTTALRQSQPRVHWLWAIEDAEVMLRVQNIILPADSALEGEPNRLLWLDSAESDGNAFEQEVSPWRMQSGERIIQKELLSNPDGPWQGQLLLLTDMDEEAARLEIPLLPNAPIQFFRPIEQRAYGLPVEPLQVDDGLWFICASEPLTFYDDEGEVIEPQMELLVPYPLNEQYHWASQVNLTLPITIKQNKRHVLTLEGQTKHLALAEPLLRGAEPIPGLSSHVPPTFSSQDISLFLEYGGERLFKQASLWLQGEDGWRCYRTVQELVEKDHATLNGDALSIQLSRLLPPEANLYTLELRASLQPLFTPLHFAVVPGLLIKTPSLVQPFTPVNPYKITLDGVTEDVVVLQEGMRINKTTQDGLVVIWDDLPKDPNLLLRLEKCDILLEWSVPRFSAWLEPKPTKPFLTLDELRKSTLHAVGKELLSEEFTLIVSDQGQRGFKLRRGHLTQPISETQFYEIVRIAQHPHFNVKVQVANIEWTLFEIRQQPDLSLAQIQFDPQEQIIHLMTGLQKEWQGQIRFLAASRTNPFAEPNVLGESTRLAPRHRLESPLTNGQYHLLIELDGAFLPLNTESAIFTVNSTSVTTQDTVPNVTNIPSTPNNSDESQNITAENRSDNSDRDSVSYVDEEHNALIAEIRSGNLISPEQVEDYVLLWAEIAEKEKTKLTPTTLYQLAAVPPFALENFQQSHLQKLWPTLAILRSVHSKAQWITKRGLLPAWILLPNPMIFITPREYEWPIYPIQVSNGGLEGKGYAIVTIMGVKSQIYVQWHRVSTTDVCLEAGIPDDPSIAWSEMVLDDTYSLAYCHHCGQLVGEKGEFSPTESTELIGAHRHGRETFSIQEINIPPEQGGYRLIGKVMQVRRGKSLLDILDEYNVIYPSAHDHLPRPRSELAISSQPKVRQLLTLSNAIFAYGANSDESSPWANATRLITKCKATRTIDEQSQGVLALGLLMRTAAYHPSRYSRLLKDAMLSEGDVRSLLAEIENLAPEHLRWGMTWAELLLLHSPGSRHKPK